MSSDPEGSDRPQLPVVGEQPAERADAARNRQRILAAAEQLVAERGASSLSMHEVAAAADVGVGTVYRRFGDVGGLAEALVDQHERQLQQEFIAGEPPLGPGAPAVERIRAFLHAYVDLLELFAELMVVAETTTPAVHLTSGAYLVHHRHLSVLIAQARPDADVALLAHALLAAVSASLFVHERRREGRTLVAIKSGLDDLVAGIGRMSSPGHHPHSG